MAFQPMPQPSRKEKEHEPERVTAVAYKRRAGIGKRVCARYEESSEPRDMDTEESCARPRFFLTPPHARELFTLKQIFGPFWLATCPCAWRTTDRSVPARCSLELNNKGDYPVIQSQCCGLCSASRLRFGHGAELPLNFLRSHAQSSKHLNPEVLVAPLVQTLQANRYENNSSRRRVHFAGGPRPAS
jgi:hypothetical protein